MAKMKRLQPQLAAIRERFPDDKAKQQEATMEIYKREKINPVAGCLPMVVQIPVFFALYKVIFITIEMRQAPFFGWIKDLSSPRPDLRVQPVRVDAIHATTSADDRHVWPLIMGGVDVRADEDESGAAGPRAEDHVHLDAGGVHLHAQLVPLRPRHLLDLEQPRCRCSSSTLIMRKSGTKVGAVGNLASTFGKKRTS